MRSPRCCLLALPLLASAALAEPAPGTAPPPALAAPAPAASCVEGFEQTFPPNGWYVQQHNPRQTWVQGTSAPHSGSAFAGVNYDDQSQVQDEWLTTPLSDYHATLVLWSCGSPYWCRDTYDNCDLELYYAPVGASSILIATLDSAWTGPSTWVQSVFDLAALQLPAGLGHLSFRYVGLDGDLVGLDDIEFPNGCPLFGSGFETGDACDWDAMQPPCSLPLAP
ncbi:MAG TPA: hypothetical protein VI942_11150 [Thermoanaerobaculia bacterium]|nr:hypothetical protein [Thermoanaerobaculia bacterium]